ncbi:MAG: methanogenesis marker 3 protein, partial [Candidatus Methanomethyliaceae archaeon]|nr:methanogenesis marker 3 protein [Candidatus Methanomethyliaceae archaeon]
RKVYKNFEGCKVRWATNEAIAFGPTISNFKPLIKEIELKQYEITISLSGMSLDESHLIFSKKTHVGLYFPPDDGDIMGKVVYGRHILELLKVGDYIEKISPIVKERGGIQLMRVNLDYVPNYGDEIITHMEISLDFESPKNGEYLYNALANGFLVSRKTSRFISHDKYVTSLEREKIGIRERGVISIRNGGIMTGSIYVYTDRAPISIDHTIVGKITKGLELADVALEGDRIKVIVNPAKIELLGKTQYEASIILKNLGIRCIREEDVSDDAIIVDHMPSTTLEIYKEGKVICKGISKNKILKIKLYRELAPVTVKYFERVTGMDLKKIGCLKVFFATKDVVLFKGNIEKMLIPENTPKEGVNAGVIGVTNSVKKNVGIIGIRLSRSEKFGPTAEGFDGSNIIGEVIAGLENLKNIRENDEIYIMEAN